MKTIKFLLLIFLSVNLKIIIATVYPGTSITTVNGEGFVVWLNTSSSNFATLSNCDVTFQSIVYDLSPTPLEAVIHITDRFESIQRFSRSICGVRVQNVSDSSAGTWTLKADSDNGEQVQGSFTLSITTAMGEVINVTAVSGEDVTISCPVTSATRFCRIRDFDGNIHEDKCEIYDKIINEPVRSYTCFIMTWGLIQEVESIINVVSIDKKPVVTTAIVETDKSVIITCQFDSSLSYCRAEFPKKTKQLLVMNSLASTRYSSYDTRTVDGRCSLEITKPLQADEKGIWKMYSGYNNRIVTGCIFGLDDQTADAEITAFLITKRGPIVIKTQSPTIELSCEAPYEISICYLKSPENNIVYPEASQLKLFSSMGRCKFFVNTMSGRWSCGINNIRGGEDIYFNYDVIYYNNTNVEVITPSVSARKSDSVELLCRTVMDYSLKSCIFISGSGNVYNVAKMLTLNRFSYYGRGLSTGDCGIKINNVASQDFGEWSCNMEIIGAFRTDSLKIQLTEEPAPILATVLGTTLGIGAIIVLGAGYIIYQKRKRQQATADDRQNVLALQATT